MIKREVAKRKVSGKFTHNREKQTLTELLGVFGIPLDVMIERDGAESGLGVGPGNLRIPQIVDDAITAMRQMGISLYFFVFSQMRICIVSVF